MARLLRMRMRFHVAITTATTLQRPCLARDHLVVAGAGRAARAQRRRRLVEFCDNSRERRLVLGAARIKPRVNRTFSPRTVTSKQAELKKVGEPNHASFFKNTSGTFGFSSTQTRKAFEQ